MSTAKKSKTPTFSRVFQPTFFWQFFSWNISCLQLKSPKTQHFHEFFTPKIDNFLGKSKLNFWTKNEDFEQCEFKGRQKSTIAIDFALPLFNSCSVWPQQPLGIETKLRIFRNGGFSRITYSMFSWSCVRKVGSMAMKAWTKSMSTLGKAALKENNFTDQFFCSAFLQQVLRHSKTVQYLDKILHKLSSKIWEIFPSNHSSKIVQKNLSKFSDKSTAWQGKQSQNGWENGFNL